MKNVPLCARVCVCDFCIGYRWIYIEIQLSNDIMDIIERSNIDIYTDSSKIFTGRCFIDKYYILAE